MAFLELSDGTPLHYDIDGEGPPIVFVPGWTMTSGMWRNQTGHFATGHRVVTLDLRGAGLSGKTPEHHSLLDYAGDVGELLDALDVKGATVVAWAMGVSVVAHLLTEVGTERIDRFVWVDHSPSFLTEPGWPFPLGGDFTESDLDAMCNAQLADRPAAVRDLLGLMFFHPLDESDARHYYNMIFQTPADVAAHMLREVATTDLRPMLARIRVPTLVVNGSESVVPTGVCGWLARQLPEGRCHVIDDAGHAPFWDQPAAFNAAVAAFLDS